MKFKELMNEKSKYTISKKRKDDLHDLMSYAWEDSFGLHGEHNGSLHFGQVIGKIFVDIFSVSNNASNEEKKEAEISLKVALQAFNSQKMKYK